MHSNRRVLADFGIAYSGGASVTVEGEKLGPLWFMAPEMRSVTKREATGESEGLARLRRENAQRKKDNKEPAMERDVLKRCMVLWVE